MLFAKYLAMWVAKSFAARGRRTRWNGQAFAGVRVAVAGGEAEVEVRTRLIRRFAGEDIHRRLQLIRLVAGHVGTEVGGFHGAGAAASGDEVAAARQAVGDASDVPIGQFASQKAMPAHDRDDVRMLVEQFVQRVVDGVVVQALGESLKDRRRFVAEAEAG